MKKMIILCLLFGINTANGQSSNTKVIENQIIQSLKNETRFFLEKDFEKWASYWVQEPYILKSYVQNCVYMEMKGWAKVREFAQNYMQEHPEKEDIPDQDIDYEITINGPTAWVSFEVNDPVRGFKKEFRRMIKKGDMWKIAFMSTVYPN